MKNFANENIYCCKCLKNVDAELISGQGAYPQVNDELQQKLWHLPFWRCPTCKNFVGCHHKTKTPTKPLGWIANKIGKSEFHTAEIRTIEEARLIYKICLTIRNIENCKNV